jgi:pimeloyl-ACP methyl ester carboxylesterase
MSRPDAKAHRQTCQPRRTAAVSGQNRPPAAAGERPENNFKGTEMALIHHVVTGSGRPPFVFVHGFACAQSDWDAQVAHLSPNHQTIAVDLRGHGASPGEAAECSIERYGADVAEVMRALALPPAVVVGHSMGCRVAVEAALQAPAQTAGLLLVDGSQFAAAMEPVLLQRFAAPGGYEALADALFNDMFTAKSDPAVAAAVLERALRQPRATGVKMLTDMLRYDVGRLAASLGCIRVPIMALQTTFSNEKRERTTMRKGQTTPYLEMLRAAVPSVRVEIVAATGHFPQLDEPAQTNALIDSFLASLPSR